jgi:hypothetical protein
LVSSSTPNEEARYFSEVSVELERSTRHYIPEDRTLLDRRCENLNSCNVSHEAGMTFQEQDTTIPEDKINILTTDSNTRTDSEKVYQPGSDDEKSGLLRIPTIFRTGGINGTHLGLVTSDRRKCMQLSIASLRLMPLFKSIAT